MRRRWFRSDDHLGHKNITKYEAAARPFGNDLEAMFTCLRDRHNALVAPGDEVWDLGDVAFSEEWARRYLTEFNGVHHLVSGNHDPTFQRRSRAARARRRYTDMGFAEVVDTATIRIGATPVTLSHFPYHGDHKADERYADLRPIDTGNWLLCGHIHSMWRTLDRMVNVGVDVWDLTPVSEDQIAAIITEHEAAA